MKNPKVSILMPTYNRVALLRRAVQSIEAQTFHDWELVVLDDASTDGTKGYLDDLAKKDPRVRPIHHAQNYYPDISRTLNEGLEIARGEYVARLDDDDYWIDARKLEKQVAFLDSHPDYTVVGGGVVVVDAAGREQSRYFKKETDAEIRQGALFANPFSHTTVLFRRDPAREAGGYGNWRYAEDWDLWLKLGTRGKLYNFPEYFMAYLMAGQNKSFVHQRPQSKMLFDIIKAHRNEYPHYYRAYAVNLAQYLYSFLPLFIRRPLHRVLSSLKRRSF